MRLRPSVLVIAGTDSSGGAGLTRDVQVLTDLHTSTLCAVTAVTVQTHQALRAIHPIPAQRVRAQIHAALQSGHVGAIKIGMLGNRSIAQAVIDSLPAREEIPIVLDPVLTTTSGKNVIDQEGIDLLLTALIPRVTVVTPNIPETAALLNEAATYNETALLQQGLRLLAMGAHAVLLKGGHGTGETIVDTLLQPGLSPLPMRSTRINGSLRGTGCALASAIAAGLAHGMPLADACLKAHAYVAKEFRENAVRTLKSSNALHDN